MQKTGRKEYIGSKVQFCFTIVVIQSSLSSKNQMIDSLLYTSSEV